MPETLKPCPFCGASAAYTDDGRGWDVSVVYCTNHDCVAEMAGKGMDEVVTLWNRRAPDPRIEKAREALAFYAQESNWDDELVHSSGCSGYSGGDCDCGGERCDGPALFDRGSKAREALAALSPKGVSESLEVE